MSAAAAPQPPAAQPPRRRKDVVSAFVQRPSDGAVLVVLRSDQVGTYQHKWGAVSGGMEAGDESAIYRCQQEILEEAGLPPSHTACARSGRPLLVDDGGRSFCVHPFLFSLRPEHAGAEVALNWENDEAAWVPPEAIRALDAVPLLAETYARLALSPPQQAAVQRLADDRQHGAAQLAAWAVDALRAEAAALAAAAAAAGGAAPAEGSGGGGAELEALQSYGYHLACCRPSMAAVANCVAAVLAAAQQGLADGGSSTGDGGAAAATAADVCARVEAAAAEEQRRLAGAAAALARHTQGLLRDGATLMTTSLSSSVLAAVKEAAEGGMRLRAYVCEARPLCEGVVVAEAWAAAGVECTLITDAQAALFVGECDLVLVGADAITSTAAVNKAGTHLLALAAAAAGVPLYVAADSAKLSPGPLAELAHPGGSGAAAAGRQQQQHEEKGAEEVAAAWGRPPPPGVAVRNVYFEDTPLPLVTGGLVTEGGVLDAPAIPALLERRRRLHRAAFGLP